MPFSAVTLAAAQAARAASLPFQLQAPSPGREALLERARQRNALLDALFYDIGVVTPEEAARLAPRWAAEGAILLVPPSEAGPLGLYLSPEELVAAAPEVSALAVAGVGSSALGTAAFARNLADAIGAPVAGVVSGYGLADLVAEALGGYFWFGTLNRVRHGFEWLDRLSEPAVVAEPVPPGASTTALASFGDVLLRSRDSRTVLALLQDERLRFTLLAGHSKGNLVISEALFGLLRRDPARTAALGAAATVVTVSARIAMPRPFRRVIDIMGAWDWFGGLNSRPSIPPDHVVPRAWHHTNSELPAHLPVTATLRQVLPRFEDVPPVTAG